MRRERGGRVEEREQFGLLEGEVAVFCLPARGAREEEERKRRERGCEDHRLVFPSLSEPASFLTPSDGHQLLDIFYQVSDVADTTSLCHQL